MATLTVFVRGKGKVKLSEEKDYMADGGEGRIYAKDGIIYKIYLDPGNMIPEAKMAELAALNLPNIIRPQDILLDEKNLVIGFTMAKVDGTELCRLFNTVFLNTNHITPEMLLKLVEKMQETTQFIHDHGCLIVDGNELNYLVDANDFTLPYFIDVNSYQTPHFPATAINVLFQDPHSPVFSTLTDWYTFGIVACKIFVGVHPFKGNHPRYSKKDILQRMKDNVSIFNADTSLPVAARDFSYIPTAYHEWFVKLFEKGERLPPPYIAGLLKVVPVAELIRSTGNFEMKMIRKYDEEIISHTAAHGKHVVITRNAVYIDHARYNLPRFTGNVIFSPKTLIPLFVQVNEKDNLLNITEMNGAPLNLSLKANRKCLVIEHSLYTLHNGDLTELSINEINNKPVASVSNVWKIMPQSSLMFDGVIYQTVLGKSYLVIPYHLSGKSYCAIKAIPELDAYKIVDGKHDHHVCMLIGVKNQTYHRLILRFDEMYNTYDLRVIEDIDYPSINFITLENGIVVSIDEHAAVEVFSNKVGASKIKKIEDPQIKTDMRLSKDGTTVLFYIGKTLYSLKMR